MCIDLCSKELASVLKAGNQDGSLPGADDFLPMMILVLKEANPDQLHSNIKYLQNYTHPMKLTGESGYILTQFMSAAVFLENADAASLTISPIEFERALQRCKELSDLQTANMSTRKIISTAGVLSNTSTSISPNAKSDGGRTLEKVSILPYVSIRDVRDRRKRLAKVSSRCSTY